MTNLKVACLALLAATALHGSLAWGAERESEPAANVATSIPQRHTNRAIAALEQGLPIFTRQIEGGAGYEDGKRNAATKADFITYEMEQGTFDITRLRDFMQGISDGGRALGTKVPVIVTLPVLGSDIQTIKANSWMIRQVMAAGISGILLCQTESPEAVKAFVETVRYPFAPGADPSIVHRGFKSEDFAMKIWDLPRNEYLERADPWPLNPRGDVMLGVKIESPDAATIADQILAVPGISLVEWAPGDQSFFLLPKPYEYTRQQAMQNPGMIESRNRVKSAAAKRKIPLIALCSADTVESQIRSGIGACYVNDDATVDRGRAVKSAAGGGTNRETRR